MTTRQTASLSKTVSPASPVRNTTPSRVASSVSNRTSGGPLSRARLAQLASSSTPPSPETIQRLQRGIGNRATKQLLQAQTANSDTETVAPARPINRTGLPDRLKAGVEALSGISLDNVRVHRNSSRPAQLNALAFAQGTDIHLAPGQDQHLPHEAWHVVQQAQGRVRPTIQMVGGVKVNDDRGLEHEADVMGACLMKSSVASYISNSVSISNLTPGTTVQKKNKNKKRLNSKNRTQIENHDDEEQEEAEYTDGSQDKIQRKMSTLLRYLFGNQPPEVVENWIRVVQTNGLCGGWVDVHRNNPVAFADTWLALREWDVADDDVTDDGLPNLPSQIKLSTVVKMLIDAYVKTSELYPEANYEEVPPEVKDLVRGDLSTLPTKELEHIKKIRHVAAMSHAGEGLVNCVVQDSAIKKRGSYYVELETELHHMGMHIKTINGKSLILSIAETEKHGAVKNPDVLRARRVIEDGLYLSGLTDYSVEITIYKYKNNTNSMWST